MNGGATMRDGAGSEDEQQSNHGNNLERRVDQEDFFQEGPNSKQGIIVGAEITDVNIPRGVNQMIVVLIQMQVFRCNWRRQIMS